MVFYVEIENLCMFKGATVAQSVVHIGCCHGFDDEEYHWTMEPLDVQIIKNVL